MKSSIVLVVIVLCLGGCSSVQKSVDDRTGYLHSIACESADQLVSSPWGIANLYDCETDTLFIPYQLWSGALWDGNKAAGCMHVADTTFYVNGISGTVISGPEKWQYPPLDIELDVWTRDKLNGSKSQYFTCHEKGIGRVHDSRRGYYPLGRCKFPAGFGWPIGVRRECRETAIEITKVELDVESRLAALEFKWWFENSNGQLIHDHTYRYEPNIGSVNAWRQ